MMTLTTPSPNHAHSLTKSTASRLAAYYRKLGSAVLAAGLLYAPVAHSEGKPFTDPIMSLQAAPSSFAGWKEDFTMRAMGSGYDLANVKRLLNHAQVNQRIISLDRSQAEFAKMPWQYVDSAVSSNRVNAGRKNFANHRALFNRIESRYGVDAEVVAGIWGMESSYGAVTGSANLVSSLATLAYEGRRREFAENQLLALMQLLARGDVRWAHMKGSWAGGMGHTQFIPATWLAQGVDADRDGRHNPWARADALSSTANYLRNSGWVHGLAPFYEVQLPSRFNYALIGEKLSLAQWQREGVNVRHTAGANANTMLTLWLPAGKAGPALLTSQNFDVIKVYNNSSSYALGVSMLGKAIARKGGLQAAWPRHEKPLSRSQVTNLQHFLTRAGYDTQGVDGVIGANTRKAFARWQANNGLVPDGFISQRSAGSLAR